MPKAILSDSHRQTPLDDLRFLAASTLSTARLARCRWLAAALQAAKGDRVQVADLEELDAKTVDQIERALRRFAAFKRAESLKAIRANEKAREEAAAAAELLDVPYEDGGTTFDILRRQVRGVTDDAWRRMLRANDQPKMHRQLRAGVWLRPGESYSYKAAEKHEDSLLNAFFTELKTFISSPSTLTVNSTLDYRPIATSEGSFGADPNQTVADASSRLPGWYVRRPSLENTILELLQQPNPQVIALVGPAGIGKSSLVRAIAALCETFTAFIRVETGKVNDSDVRTAMQAANIKDDPSSSAGVRLALLVTSGQAPDLVILDNLDRPEEVQRVLPNRLRSHLIMTCRRHPLSTSRDITVIDVGPLDDDESRKLLVARLGVLANDATDQAVQALGGYPLAIDYCSGIALAAKLSVNDVCYGLKVIPGEIYTESGEDLYALLRQLTENVRRQNITSLLLLFMAVFDSGISESHWELDAKDLICSLYGLRAPVVFEYGRALKLLNDYCLVRVEHDISELKARERVPEEDREKYVQFLVRACGLSYDQAHREAHSPELSMTARILTIHTLTKNALQETLAPYLGDLVFLVYQALTATLQVYERTSSQVPYNIIVLNRVLEQLASEYFRSNSVPPEEQQPIFDIIGSVNKESAHVIETQFPNSFLAWRSLERGSSNSFFSRLSPGLSAASAIRLEPPQP